MIEQERDGLRLVMQHIHRVQVNMAMFMTQLAFRSAAHDQTKFHKEELPLVVGKAAMDKLEYMSEEERALVASVETAVKHHYDFNSHHPEHYENGVAGMTLLDVVEMFCDWKAASDASPGGGLLNSIEKSKERFDLDPQLVAIFENTARVFGWDVKAGNPV